MAEIAKVGRPTMVDAVPCPAHQETGLVAGEAIAVGDLCYIAAAGTVFRSNGTAANLAATVDGMAEDDYAVGDANVTIWHNVHFRYASALVPGTRYFVSATVPGGIADAATTGGTSWVCKARDAQTLYVRKSTY